MKSYNIDEIKIHEKTPIVEALSILDSSKKELLLTHDGGRVTGYVSDFLLRRVVVEHQGLDLPVSDFAIKDFFYVNSVDYEQIRDFFVRNSKVEILPVLNQKTVKVYYRSEFLNNHVKPVFAQIPAVIMAGGEGTRLLPYTKIIPKPLLPIGNKTIIEHIIERFRKIGVRQFILTLNYKANLIKAFFNDQNPDYKIKFIQEPKPLGTAGSLHYLAGQIDKPFFVSNCDILINTDLRKFYRFHLENEFDLSLIAAVVSYQVPYGVCRVDKGHSLLSIDEKPTYYFLVNSGMYVLSPHVLELIPADQMFHITQLIDKIIDNGGKVGVYPISQNSWKDFGQIKSVHKLFFKNKIK